MAYRKKNYRRRSYRRRSYRRKPYKRNYRRRSYRRRGYRNSNRKSNMAKVWLDTLDVNVYISRAKYKIIRYYATMILRNRIGYRRLEKNDYRKALRAVIGKMVECKFYDNWKLERDQDRAERAEKTLRKACLPTRRGGDPTSSTNSAGVEAQAVHLGENAADDLANMGMEDLGVPSGLKRKADQALNTGIHDIVHML